MGSTSPPSTFHPKGEMKGKKGKRENATMRLTLVRPGKETTKEEENSLSGPYISCWGKKGRGLEGWGLPLTGATKVQGEKERSPKRFGHWKRVGRKFLRWEKKDVNRWGGEGEGGKN